MQVKKNCIYLNKGKLRNNYRLALGLHPEGNRRITIIFHNLTIHQKVVEEDAVSLPHKWVPGACMSLSHSA